MKASVIESPQQIRTIETDIPDIEEEEVLVKLTGSGLCISNLPVWEGREWFYYPFEPGTPGHEGFGFVEQIGNMVSGLSKGDRVALISYHAYAEYDKAHVSNVVRIPGSLNQIPFLGEPAACAVNIFNRSCIQSDHNVVIIGAGYIGCLLIQLVKSAGAKVVAISRRNTSLDYAERSGADHMVKFISVEETKKEVEELTGRQVDRVIEATGAQHSLDLATEIIKERGRMIIAGYHQDGLRNINLQKWNWKGIDVINAHERDQSVYIQGLREAVKKTEEGILKPHELITHFFELEDINRAFGFLGVKPEGFLKGVIVNS
jgi:2-desacetyl-2-hydroxyethyl bacteriochlorophyllide A dehydrogenase